MISCVRRWGRVASRAWSPPPKAVEQTRRVEGVAAGPHAVEQTLRGRRKNTGAKRQMSKNGGRGTGFTGKSLHGAGSMGVKSSRMALRLLSATAAPASTTSLPNIFLGRSWRLGPRQNLGQKTKPPVGATRGPARGEISSRRPSGCDKKAARREACAESATGAITLD